jgi:hypothetical protein
MPGGRSGEKRSADVIGAATCGPNAGASSMNRSFRNAFASSKLSPQLSVRAAAWRERQMPAG